MSMKVNPELHSLIPPLSADEYAQLEANILQDGCRDPLIIWEEEETLLDGHNRRTICEHHGLPYTCQAISLPDLDAAKAWMIANQLGRRNLTPEQISYYRGGQYNLQKHQGKRTDLTSGQSDQKSQNAAEQLAQQHTVSEKTIRRDAAYAKAVDTIAEAVGPEARTSLLARETKVSQADVHKLAQMAKDSPQVAKHVLEAVAEAKTPKLASHHVQAAHREHARLSAYGAEAELAVEPEIPKAEPSTPAVVDPAPIPVVAPVITFTDLVDRACAALEDCSAMVTKHPASIPDHLDAALLLGEVCGTMIEVLGAIPAVRTYVEPLPVPAPPVATGKKSKAHNEPLKTDTKPVQEDTLLMRVWRFVQEHQPCTNAQVRQALEIPRNQAFNILKMLVKQGKVRKDGEQYLDNSL
jgi:hypothetical protein